jgi:ABC-type branched-subunit amino acid transport system substrate-binding protein
LDTLGKGTAMTAKSPAAIAIVAFAAVLASLAARGVSAEELRIGFLVPSTGSLAQIAIDMVNGFEMYLKDHDGKLGAATVKLIVEDTRGSLRPPC